MMFSSGGGDVLDREFLGLRGRLLEVAAVLDRIHAGQRVCVG